MLGQYLDQLTWEQAQEALSDHSVVIIPIGARSKEHGHHLPLNTDWILAEYLTGRVLEQCRALALPTLQYGYYPAFVEYPGSIHIQRQTFEQTVCDICRSLARHGDVKFYLLNTGISTNWALEPARLVLQQENIVMEFTDLTDWLEEVAKPIQQQPRGTHADQIETSMMLYIRPDVVKMDRARPDTNEQKAAGGGLTRNPDADRGVYSPTGAWGDPTLATVETGRIVVEALVQRIVSFVESFGQGDYTPAPRRDRYLNR